MGKANWNEPVLAPTEVDRQHYVPRFVLRRFAEDGLVSVLQIESGRTFSTSPENIAVERNYYDFQDPRGELSAEGWLAELESEAAPIIGQLADDATALPILDAGGINALTRFIAAQTLRSPALRELNNRTRENLIAHVKDVGRRFLERDLGKRAAEELWQRWKDKPDEWFLHEEEPHQAARTVAALLGEVQGFANLLQAMPWRIGTTASPIFTSDNGFARHTVPTIRFAGNRFAGYPDHTYYFPLSPTCVLKIGPHLTEDRQHHARVADYSDWESSLIRHVIRLGAHRYLYGPGPYLSEACSTRCLDAIDRAMAEDAMRYQGWKPDG